LLLGVFCIKGLDAMAVEMTSPISIKIVMGQDAFTFSQPIEGRIILTSLAPSTVQAVFEVNIFLNGASQRSYLIEIKSVLPGRNFLSLQDFGIHLPMQAGKWTLVIKQQGLNEKQAAAADFVINSST
jgi:hypothetical protein